MASRRRLPAEDPDSAVSTRRLATLARVAEELNRQAEPGPMLDSAARLACELIGANSAWVFAVEDGASYERADGTVSVPGGPGFVPVAGHHLPEVLASGDLAGLRWGPCKCQIAALEGTGDPVNVDRCERLAQCEGSDRQPASHGSVSLRSGGQLLGVLNVGFDVERVLDEDELNLLSIVGETLGLALHRAYAFESAVVDERAAVEALAASERRLRSLVRNASDVLVVCDSEAAPFYVSPVSERVIGYSPEEVLALSDPFTALVHPEDAPRVLAGFEEVREVRGRSMTVEFRLLHRDGSWRNCEGVLTNLLDDPDISGIVANVRDVTERARFVQELARRTFFDSLTGLPNRTQFLDRLEFAIARAASSDRTLSVLLVDIDDFHVVNDSIGHAAGDDLLRDIATRLRSAAPSEAIVARLGGDEFAVLCEECPKVDDALALGRRLAASLREPFRIAGRELRVSSSVGVATACAPHSSPEDLLRDADLAPSHARHSGRDSIEAFDAAMRARTVARMESEHSLRRAIERSELRVLYQPEIELATGRIMGMEALVAWQHPERGLVNAGQFIELAEETGLVVPLSEWVLSEACRYAKRRQDASPDAPIIPVSVNVSALQIDRTDLPEVVAGALGASALEAAGLVLEITESSLLEDPDRAISVLKQLTDMGVLLALDDFGTGYSSFSYLRRLPVSVLKIDRAFVAALGAGGADAAMVAAIADLGHALGLVVLAEGVENVLELQEVVALGCDLGQGYYWSRPVLPDDLEAWEAQRSAGTDAS